MIKKLYSLFKIGRTLAKADALNYFEEIYNPPLIVIIVFKILGFNFKSTNQYTSAPSNEKFISAVKKLGPIGKSYEQLKTGVFEEKEALKNLKLDIQNGEGERNLYDQHITFESTKIKQLNTLLISYKGSKSEAMEVFGRLHRSR